jgi:hypothetical protein
VPEGRKRLRERLENAWWTLVVVAFIAFPFWWWYAVLTGRFDMSAPMDDPYVSDEDGPGTRQGLRYFGLTLWTLVSLALLFLILQKQVKDLRERRARRRDGLGLD